MSSSAVTGKGTEFRRWDESAWVTIAEINTITGPGMTRDVVDVTSLDSIDGWREFIAGFRDGGTIALSMNFTRAEYATFLADFESDTLKNYEIVLPDAENTTLEFEGLVTELPLTIPTDDKITVDSVIKMSGPPTLNSGSGPSPA